MLASETLFELVTFKSKDRESGIKKKKATEQLPDIIEFGSGSTTLLIGTSRINISTLFSFLLIVCYIVQWTTQQKLIPQNRKKCED